MGENGQIHLEDNNFNVNEDGMIYSKDGEFIDRIKVVRFDNERYLKKWETASGLQMTFLALPMLLKALNVQK